MNRNTLLGWAALMLVFLAWTQYKSNDARKHMQEIQRLKADSLAKVEAANPKKLSTETALKPASEPITATATTMNAQVAKAPVDSNAIAQQLIRVETSRFVAILDNQGARISELRIFDLEGKPVANTVLIRPESEGALTLTLDNQSLAKTLWSVDAKNSVVKVGSEPVTISFKTKLAQGEVTRKFTFSPNAPTIRHEVELPASIAKYAIEWNGGMEETEKIAVGKGVGLNSGFFSEVVYDNGVSAQRSSFSGEKTFNAESGVLRWVGMRRKYMAIILDFHKDIQDPLQATAVKPEGASDSDPKHYKLRIAGDVDDGSALNFDVVVLPLQYETVKAMGRNYEQILFSGWEWFMRADIWYVKLCGLVLRLLNMFYQWIPNYGVAIILLTLLVRTLTMPLSIIQIRQTSRMVQHQPEIRKLQEKYRGDRAKMQTELMAYYRLQGINPLAPVMGCLPALLQMPVFISLFNVLGRAVELHDMPFMGWIKDLSLPDVILPSLQVPFLFPVGLTVLPFFMAATMWWQMKMTITDPNQKAMVWLMPIMMFVFSCSFPSGLVLYWTVSNIFTIVQTHIFKPKPLPVAILSSGKPKASTRA